MQNELDELLVGFLADVLDEAVGRQSLSKLEGGETVLRETKVEEGRNWDAGGLTNLFLLLGEVGAPDEPDSTLVAKA